MLHSYDGLLYIAIKFIFEDYLMTWENTHNNVKRKEQDIHQILIV